MLKDASLLDWRLFYKGSKYMAFEVQNTNDLTSFEYFNGIIYGPSGVGKTVLLATAPKPLILSAERGLLSIAGKNISYSEISSLDDINEAYKFISNGNHDFQTLCFDSISEVAEKILAKYKLQERDKRAAYGRMAEEIIDLVRKFKDLKINLVLIAKQTRNEDGFTGKTTFGPSYPGQVLTQNFSYHLDLVLAMRLGSKDGQEFRYLQTAPDIQYEAKDRSGFLEKMERPDLGFIFKKIRDGFHEKAKESLNTEESNPPQ